MPGSVASGTHCIRHPAIRTQQYSAFDVFDVY